MEAMRSVLADLLNAFGKTDAKSTSTSYMEHTCMYEKCSNDTVL